MGNTTIEWTNKVWNPTTGCTKVGPGCLNCYAETIARRFQQDGPYVPWTVKAQRESGRPAVTLHPEKLDQPLKWRKPQKVFVNSMSDLFHEDVPDHFIEAVFARMAMCQHHTFQVLTKRPQRMMEWVKAVQGGTLARKPLKNVWLGVSVENQRYADERIPLLAKTPAAVRFISAEPLLGPVDLTGYLHQMPPDWWHDTPSNNYYLSDDYQGPPGRPYLDWVIVGGESGPNARPMESSWARSLKNQCEAAGVPFFFKQWGQWLPTDQRDIHEGVYGSDGPDFVKLGKGKAGHYLDNQVYQQFPEVA